MANGIWGQGTDSIAEAINNFFQGGKYFIAKSHIPELLPDLLNWVHLRRIGWDEEKTNVFRHNQCPGFMPGGTVTAKEDYVVRILF